MKEYNRRFGLDLLEQNKVIQAAMEEARLDVIACGKLDPPMPMPQRLERCFAIVARAYATVNMNLREEERRNAAANCTFVYQGAIGTKFVPSIGQKKGARCD